jgi:hypothetical protein
MLKAIVIIILLESVSRLTPKEFEEIFVRIFCRYKSQSTTVKSLFEEVYFIFYIHLFKLQLILILLNNISGQINLVVYHLIKVKAMNQKECVQSSNFNIYL